MRGFENCIALPDVLDEVHRRTIIEALSRVGVRLATNSWSEIEATITIPELPVDPDDVFSRVEYTGAGEEQHGSLIPVGPLFGEMYTLARSGDTPYFHDQALDSALGRDKFRRYISLYAPAYDLEYPHFTNVYLLRDMPPMMVHVTAYTTLIDEERIEVDALTDIELINLAYSYFGESHVQPVSEDVAGQLIYALENESKRLFNLGKDY